MNPDAPLPPAEPILPTEPVLPNQPSTARKIFFGKDGLRAGWSLLIFIAIFAAVIFCVNFGLRKYLPHDTKAAMPAGGFPPRFLFLAEGIPFAVTVFVTWIMSKIERRPVGVYGLGDNRKPAHFFAGLGWGVVCLSLLIFTLVKTGHLVFDSRLLFGSDVLRYGAIWLLGFFLVGLLEEYLTRGFVQYTLTRGFAGLYQLAFKTRHSRVLGFWTSALVLSILFGLGHGKNPGESPIGLLSAGLAGMVFCFSLWRTGSLWFAIGLHTSWDWGQSFLYGVADSGMMAQHHLFATHPVGPPLLSGGATGPEGSVFILAILAIFALIIVFTLPRARYGEMAEHSAMVS